MTAPDRSRPITIPEKCGEAYELLASCLGTENVARLSRASGISRSTLAYWKSCPRGKLRAGGREHLRRILAERDCDAVRSSPDPSLAALIEMFQEVRDILLRIERQFLKRF